MCRAFRQRTTALFHRAGGRDHLGACSQRKPHGGETDATHRRMYEHALAGLHIRHVTQGPRRSHVRIRQRHRIVERECRWLGHGQRCFRERICRERIRSECHHVITDTNIGDICADSRHDTTALAAERTGVTGVHAKRVQHIAEVQPGCANRDLDFVCIECAATRRDQREVVEHAALGDHEGSPITSGGGQLRQRLETWHEKDAVPPRELRSRVRERQPVDDRCRDVHATLTLSDVQAQCASPTAFDADGTRQTGQCYARQIRHVRRCEGEGRPAHDREARGRKLQHRLAHVQQVLVVIARCGEPWLRRRVTRRAIDYPCWRHVSVL